MPLDPQARAHLDRLLAQPTAPLQSVTPQVARRDFEAWSAEFGLAEVVRHVEDRTIPGPGGDIPIRIYDPCLERPCPLLVFFHGGGWVVGSVNSFDVFCRK